MTVQLIALYVFEAVYERHP